MKALKRIGIGLLGLILLLVVISFFLPRKVRVQRSTEINAAPDVAFNLVNNLKSWSNWSPWLKMDPDMKLVYGDIVEGTGASYVWESKHPQVGNGKLTIVESKPNEHIRMEMEFMDHGKGIGEYSFIPTEKGVKVTWVMESDMGMNPVGKWMGLFMDKMLGADFEKGLNNMKEAAENMPPPKETIAGFDFEERNMDKMTIAGIREKVYLKELGAEKFGGWYGTIGKALSKAKMEQSGYPMAIYYTYSNDTSDMEAAVPVIALSKDAGPVKFHELPATKAIIVKYYGDYSKTESVYNEAFGYLEKKGLTSNGAPMEIFVTDPGMEKDTAKWLTEIAFPIQ